MDNKYDAEKRFDDVIIADNYQPRIEQIANYLLKTNKTTKVETFLIDRNKPAELADQFNQRVKLVLGSDKELLVINNYYVGLKNGYLRNLAEIEEAEEKTATKVIVSCLQRERIQYALREMPGLVEVVGYDQENGGVKISELEAAMNDNLGRANQQKYSRAS